MVPISAVQHYFVAGDTVRSIGISVAEADQIDSGQGRDHDPARERHDIAAGGTTTTSASPTRPSCSRTVDSISSLLTVLLGGIASISLLVGGIGIMNIMLVSVRERTREIGIRKADRRPRPRHPRPVPGRGPDPLAPRRAHRHRPRASASRPLIGQLAGWGFVFNPVTVVVAVLFSLLVGVVFGVWPARQAARLDPIVALRYE